MRQLFSWMRKWSPGLVPLAILWIAAIWTSTAPIEAGLTARSVAELKDTVLDKTDISASGRDVRLSAEAFSEEGRHSAVSRVEAVPGVRLVNDDTRLIPAVKPFVWLAERDVVRVTLYGNTPLPAIKSRLMDAARPGALKKYRLSAKPIFLIGSNRAPAFQPQIKCNSGDLAFSRRHISGRIYRVGGDADFARHPRCLACHVNSPCNCRAAGEGVGAFNAQSQSGGVVLPMRIPS